MRKERAKIIGEELNNTDRWHTHGYGISMEVLQNDKNLKLLIHDFDSFPAWCDMISSYNNLFDDYMSRRSHKGVIHTIDNCVPFM